MLRRVWPVLFALLLAPALALGDGAPPDDDRSDDDSRPSITCNEFCHAAETCYTDCVPYDCASYCSENPILTSIGCVVDSKTCSSFNKCLCGSIAFDDSDDESGSKDSSGCGVISGKTDILLPAIMLMIGLSALAYSLKSKRP